MFDVKTYDSNTVTIHWSEDRANEALSDYLSECTIEKLLPTKYGFLEAMNLTEEDYRIFVLTDGNEVEIESMGYRGWVKRFLQSSVLRIKNIWYQDLQRQKSGILMQMFNEQFSDTEKVFSQKVRDAKQKKAETWDSLLLSLGSDVKTLAKPKGKRSNAKKEACYFEK